MLEHRDRKIPSLAEMVRTKGQRRVPFFVGGIGPASQIPFQRELLAQNLTAKTDQQHVGYILANATSIPDRTTALNERANGDTSKYDEVKTRILDFARAAKDQEFDSISFLCNTIHAWREDVLADLEAIGIPWTSMIDAVVQKIRKDFPGEKRIGILGTDGTLMVGLYTKALEEADLTPVNLELGSDPQKDVMDAIYTKGIGIKATSPIVSPEAIKKLSAAADHLADQGVKIIIGGCTEIPLGLNENTYQREGVTLIDPLVALAELHLDLAFNPDSSTA